MLEVAKLNKDFCFVRKLEVKQDFISDKQEEGRVEPWGTTDVTGQGWGLKDLRWMNRDKPAQWGDANGRESASKAG